MRQYGYLVVEGPHDVEFAYCLLRPFAMKRVQYKNELDEFLHPLIPKEFPPKNGDLQQRMPIPLFLQNQTHAIAIRSATGDSQLVNVMVSSVELLADLNAVIGIGILLDSDQQISAKRRYAELQKELTKKSPHFKLHDELGKVRQGKPNFGAFVLPDNSSVGTLEDLLIQSAGLVYPNLLTIARNYVNEAKNTELSASDLKYINKPAGENKAIVGAMANIMRPGKAVQTSIQDNAWLKGDALSLPTIKSVQDFLKTLFDLF